MHSRRRRKRRREGGVASSSCVSPSDTGCSDHPGVPSLTIWCMFSVREERGNRIFPPVWVVASRPPVLPILFPPPSSPPSLLLSPGSYPLTCLCPVWVAASRPLVYPILFPPPLALPASCCPRLYTLTNFCPLPPVAHSASLFRSPRRLTKGCRWRR